MERRGFRIAVCILAAVIVVLAGLNIRQAQIKTWDVCYEMTNQRVEWTGAGYSGIYGGENGN